MTRRAFACLLASLLFSFPAHAYVFDDHLHAPKKAPPFVFVDGAGQQHALADFRGHYVLLNIWASWCGPCVHEMPSLDALQKEFPQHDLIVLPISEDRGEGVVGAFYRRRGLTSLPIAIDRAGVAPTSFTLDGLPTTFLIDPLGQEIGRFEGGIDWDQPRAVVFLHAQLDAKASVSARP